MVVNTIERPKESKECNPINIFTYIFSGTIMASVVWTFYSVAIEILPFQHAFNSCSENDVYNLNNDSINKECRTYLDSMRSYDNTASTFWSLMIIAGFAPWLVLCFVAIITSHDKVVKKHKQCFWVILGVLIALYFITMIASSFHGISVYLYGSPAYIGAPLCIIIPSMVYYMKKINICKKFIRALNPFIVITYIMISVSLVILTSYIVWEPSSYADLHYKSSILIGCAYFFAWLAALIMSFEIHFMYTYDEYPAVKDYNISTFQIKPPPATENDLEQGDMSHAEIQQNILQEKMIAEQKINADKKMAFPILGHFLSFIMMLTLCAWLSMSNAAGNISILALISIFPFIGKCLINLQDPFNQYMLSKYKH